MFTFAAEI